MPLFIWQIYAAASCLNDHIIFRHARSNVLTVIVIVLCHLINHVSLLLQIVLVRASSKDLQRDRSHCQRHLEGGTRIPGSSFRETVKSTNWAL